MHPVLKANIEIIGKPYSDLHFLLQCLSEVLEANNEKELIHSIPWLNTKVMSPVPQLEQKTIQLYSICFHRHRNTAIKYLNYIFHWKISCLPLSHYALQTNIIHKYLMFPVCHNYKLKRIKLNLAVFVCVCRVR